MRGVSAGSTYRRMGKGTAGSAWVLWAYVAAILATLPVLPLLWIPLRDKFAPTAERSLTALLVLLGIAIGLGLIRRPLSSRASLLPVAAVYGWFLWSLDNPVEKTHFAEYGFLSHLSLRYLRDRDPGSAGGRRPLGPREGWGLRARALALVFSVGLLDEFIQYLLPNRYGELKDVGFNWLAGLLGLIVSEIWDGWAPGRGIGEETP